MTEHKTRKKTASRIKSACAGLLLAGMLASSGCATLNETYYLMAHDKTTDSTNIYRIRIHGCSTASKTKYSTGFYDREAVERLFGEAQLQREYLATQVSQYNESGRRVENLSSQLAKTEEAELSFRISELERVSVSIAQMVGQYRVKLASNPDLEKKYNALMDSIDTKQKRAIKFLANARKALADLPPNKQELPPNKQELPPNKQELHASKRMDRQVALALVAIAAWHLREALGSVNGIRMAIDGKNLVRFFDAAGNEIDVSNKKLVIFVASDVSKFSEALRQLAETAESEDSILRTIQGRKFQEATALAAEVERSDKNERELVRRLDEILGELDRSGVTDDIKKSVLLRAAGRVADRVFAEPKDVDVYIQRRQQP